MRIEERDDYVDLVAQAVIDRIEERDRIAGLVELVVARVLSLQREQMQAQAASLSSNHTEAQDGEKQANLSGNA